MIVDLFAGGGGASLGIEMALGAAALDGRQSEAYSIWCASSGREATEDEIAEVAS